MVKRPASKQQRPVSAKIAFKGVLFEVWQWSQTLFDGSKRTFERLQRPDTVLVLPVLDDGRIILSDETQPGMKPMIRTLGGRIESAETPEEAARRELLEESGYTAKKLVLWDAWQPVNKIDWAVYLYVAHGLKKSKAKNLEPGERIKLRRVSKEELLDGNSKLVIDDYELLHKLYFARSNDKEKKRVMKLLTQH